MVILTFGAHAPDVERQHHPDTGEPLGNLGLGRAGYDERADHGDLEGWLKMIYALGVDAVFSDFPAAAVNALDYDEIKKRCDVATFDSSAPEPISPWE